MINLPGTKVAGKVTKHADFGVFVELQPGVEGMIHVSELDDENNKPEVGADVDVIVLRADPVERRFELSQRAVSKGLDDSHKRTIETAKEAANTTTGFAEAFARAQKNLTDTKRDYEDRS